MFDKHGNTCQCTTCQGARREEQDEHKACSSLLRAIMRELDVDKPTELPMWVINTLPFMAGFYGKGAGVSREALHKLVEFGWEKRTAAGGGLPIDVVSQAEFDRMMRADKKTLS